MEERTSRLGHEGYAQLAEGLQMGMTGATGERDEVEEVVDGGESRDLSVMCKGFAKANRGDVMDSVEDEGDSDLLLYSDNIFFVPWYC